MLRLVEIVGCRSVATLSVLLLVSSGFAAAPPNIILCMGDDHGWDETGYNGHPHVQTPVLDEMAATGLRLDNFYSGHPTCSPTRGSFITGRHPNRYGTFAPNWSIRPEEIGVAKLLAGAGYRTGHFGKWHLNGVKQGSPTNPAAMGFDEWLSHDNFFEVNPVLSRNGGPPREYAGESSELIVAETIDFIRRSQESGKPFFAVVWFGSPHEPYVGLEKDLALYDDLPQEYADRSVRLTSVVTGQSTTRPFREVLRERLAEITAMDRSLGQLRDFLREEQLRDDTLLFYCGDNGVPSSGRLSPPFRGQKGNVYEGGVRVPGVIEWPAKIDSPRNSSTSCVTSDLLPTLCDLVQIAVPSRPVDGISLKPLLEGRMTVRPEPICFWSFNTGREEKLGRPWIEGALQEGTTPLAKMMAGKYTRTFRNFTHPNTNEQDYLGARAIVDGNFKLVVHDKQNQESVELFNLRNDRGEQRDLSHSQPDKVAELQRKLLQWQDSVLNSLVGNDY